MAKVLALSERAMITGGIRGLSPGTSHPGVGGGGYHTAGRWRREAPHIRNGKGVGVGVGTFRVNPKDHPFRKPLNCGLVCPQIMWVMARIPGVRGQPSHHQVGIYLFNSPE